MCFQPLFMQRGPCFKLLWLFLGKGWIGGCKLALGKTNGPSGDFLFSSLFQAVVDSVLAVRKQDEPIDLHMVEIMEMKHKSETDTA